MKAVLALLLCCVAASASAQSPVTATSGVAFDASTDHVLTNTDGSPIVARYEVRFQIAAGGPVGCASVPAVDLGKPTPVTNLITVRPLPPFATLPANCVYTLTVAAIGPGGEGVSTATPPFSRRVLKVPAAPARPPTVLP